MSEIQRNLDSIQRNVRWICFEIGVAIGVLLVFVIMLIAEKMGRVAFGGCP